MTQTLRPSLDKALLTVTAADALGNPAAIPADPTFVSSDPSIIGTQAVDGQPDQQFVVPFAAGSASVTVTSGSLPPVVLDYQVPTTTPVATQILVDSTIVPA